MKISFSTLGCPDWRFGEIVSSAKDLGYDGIEIRGLAHEINAPRLEIFNEENIVSTLNQLRKVSIDIPCLTSEVFLFDKENNDKMLEMAKEYIDLADRIGTKYIRLLADKNPAAQGKIDEDLVYDNIMTLVDYIDQKDVVILIESNGVYADSKKLALLMAKCNSDKVGVLWDIHHPYRFLHESVEQTYDQLSKYIKHVHIKDSIKENGSIHYRMLGYGDVPVVEALKLLRENEYDGYVSLEWVKRWNMNLEEPGVVFAHFINYIKMYTK